MVITVRSRPTHYDTLCVSPTASADEICNAFARRMGIFSAQSVASTAELSVAFEVLRDAQKRRAYDRAIGLVPEPEQPRQWAVSGAIRSSPRFLGSGWRKLDEIAAERPPAPTAEATPASPKPTESAGPDTAAPRVASFLAASLREPAAPAAEPPREPEPQVLQPPAAASDKGDALVREIEQILGPRRAGQPAVTADTHRIQWKQPAAIAAAILGSAVLIGGYAGVWVTDGEPTQPADQAVTVGLPAARPSAERVAGAAASAPSAYEAAAQASAAASTGPRAPKQVESRQQPTLFAQKVVNESTSAAAALGSTAVPVDAALGSTDAPAAASEDPLAPKAEPVSASLPLSKATIASTIRRIGYPCASVVDTTSAGGGVFSVTCSSGHTYRASPVRGRYHFRRAGRN